MTAGTFTGSADLKFAISGITNPSAAQDSCSTIAVVTTTAAGPSGSLVAIVTGTLGPTCLQSPSATQLHHTRPAASPTPPCVCGSKNSSAAARAPPLPCVPGSFKTVIFFAKDPQMPLSKKPRKREEMRFHLPETTDGHAVELSHDFFCMVEKSCCVRCVDAAVVEQEPSRGRKR